MILRDTYKEVHLLGHREHPAHRSICGMVDARWPWAAPHLTDDPIKTNCGLCLRIRREREIKAMKPTPEDIIRGLLEILDSPHIRHCEALASVHGHSLDKETSERYGDTIKQARALLSKEPQDDS